MMATTSTSQTRASQTHSNRTRANQSVVHITGMTCKACEVRVGKALRSLPQAENVSVSAAKGQAVITHRQPLPPDQVEAAIAKAGYQVGATKRPWLAQDPAVWRDVLTAAAILMALVLVVRTLDLTRWLDQLSLGATTGNLLLVAVLGVTASVSTCMALVGGLVLSLSARHAAQHPNVGTAGKFRPQLLFNLGRVVGFTLLGALIGLVGRIVAFQGSFLTAAIILASVVMGFLGLKLTGISPRLSGFSFTLPAALTKRINGAAESSVRAKAAGKTSDIRGSTANGRGNGRDSRRATNTRTARYSDVNAAGLGVASFFLPCGFTQAVQVYALSTGDPLQAGLVMGVFALGTTPGLVGIGTLGAFARGPRAARMLRAVGVLVIAFTLVNLSGTWRTLVPPAASAISPNTVTADSAPDGIQQAVIKVTGQGYEPEHTVIEAGKPAELIFELEAFGCAAILDAGPLGVPETITLDTDRTTVEIPPLEPGTYSYSCAMGMFWGSVTAK